MRYFLELDWQLFQEAFNYLSNHSWSHISELDCFLYLIFEQRLTTRWNAWITCRYFAAFPPQSPGCAALLGWHWRLWSIITSHSQCRVTSAPHFSTGCLLIRQGRELWSSCGVITSTSYACVPNMEQWYFRFSSVRGCLNMLLYPKFVLERDNFHWKKHKVKMKCEFSPAINLSWKWRTW